MRPTDILREEHGYILTGLGVLEAMAGSIDSGGEVPFADAELIVDFLRYYADGLHHAKEEDVLFPALLDAGLPRNGGPVSVMLHEHTLGRQFIRTMLEALPAWEEPIARRSYAAAARGFASLLDQHIAKENAVLFRMADQLLEPSRDAGLLDRYAAREADARATCGEKNSWQRKLEGLAATYR
jgi:hemerythrin-like domain-containing protein